MESPLLFAAAGGHTDVVNTLLAHGADANTENYAHATALSFAAATGSLRTVDRLLNAGARVDHRDVWGATALMKAAERGHTDCVRALLDHGAAIDSRDHESRTAMMDAAEEGKTAVVRLLLARGAKVSLRGRDDATGATVTALSLAQTCRHPNIVALLRQAGATDILQSKAIARQPKPTAHYLGDPPTYIPPIARIVGVRVGYDSMEDLDRNLGSGVMMMGGHPHGARDWTLLPHGSIDADGFDYSKRGRVIDDLGVIAPLSD